jgi:hypothetical protein
MTMADKYRCYGKDDFGHPYDALSMKDEYGEWVRTEDYDTLAAELAGVKHKLKVSEATCELAYIPHRALVADRDQISLTLAVAKADRDKWFGRARDLQAALTLLYDKWENGDDCYEDPERFGGFLGKAFKLNEAEENQVLALIGSTPETGTKFTGESREALCTHCGKTFYQHSNFDASCVTSSKSCSDARPQGQEDPGERTHPKAPVQIGTERSVTGGQAAESPFTSKAETKE